MEANNEPRGDFHEAIIHDQKNCYYRRHSADPGGSSFNVPTVRGPPSKTIHATHHIPHAAIDL